ncbi:MAG: TIGR04211 family SH3 domain-containing protein [Halioglobus sp.]|nr:TIGR04211 family SH3 domain-containing protein [Halioglobus sp.]
MRCSVPLLLLSFICCAASFAQDIRYVSDKQYVPLRTGAGNEYRIVHKGIVSGTRLTVGRTSEDKQWSEITTDGGTSGWIRTQYLMSAVPAQLKLTELSKQAEKSMTESTDLNSELEILRAQQAELLEKLTTGGSDFDAVSQELAQLKKISGKSVQLDADNRRLVVQTENLRSEAEMLESENYRLQEKLDSEDFFNGAMAVLLGVIIALVAPRLVPKRRKSSSWA